MSAGILVLVLQAAAAGGYVQVVATGAPITSSPGGGAVIGHAERGTIVECVGRLPAFYAVRLFSGRTRYVRRAAARPVLYNPQPPVEPAVVLQLTSALVAAQVRADREATPALRTAGSDPRRRRATREDPAGGRRDVLLDHYQLDVMARFELNPPVHALLPEVVRADAGR